MDPRINDPADAIRIQRYFRVSWPTTLVRLKQMNSITQATARRFEESVRPVHIARSLGYAIDAEELRQDPRRWRVRRFPRQFLRMLRSAVLHDVISPMTAASLSGLSLPDIVDLMGQVPPHDDEAWQLILDEFAEFRESGVI